MSQENAQVQVLNLARLQLALDEIVFENIDTGYKWSHAQNLLQDLYAESEQFFISYVKSRNGELPRANSYWALFTDLVSKMMYFIAFTKQQQNDNVVEIASAYKAAARLLPNCQQEGSIEFYEEIRRSYEQVTQQQLPVEQYTIQQTIQFFYEKVMK